MLQPLALCADPQTIDESEIDQQPSNSTSARESPHKIAAENSRKEQAVNRTLLFCFDLLENEPQLRDLLADFVQVLLIHYNTQESDLSLDQAKKIKFRSSNRFTAIKSLSNR